MCQSQRRGTVGGVSQTIKQHRAVLMRINRTGACTSSVFATASKTHAARCSHVLGYFLLHQQVLRYINKQVLFKRFTDFVSYESTYFSNSRENIIHI